MAASREPTVAVVTGAGRGIGKATALELARAGMAVAAVARTAAEIEKTAAEIQGRGGRALAVPADVSRWSDMQRFEAETRRRLGPAEVVVANAAVVPPLGLSWELDPAAWAGNIGVNLSGAFHTVRAFLPAMRERRRGVLIFVSTGLAVEPLPRVSAYAAGKAGLEQLVRTLALEVAEERLPIRVYGIYPGIVDTPMQAELRDQDPSHFPETRRFRQFKSHGWLRAPEEPAALIRWLATRAPPELHGRMVSVSDAAIRRRVEADLRGEARRRGG